MERRHHRAVILDHLLPNEGRRVRSRQRQQNVIVAEQRQHLLPISIT
jgi:hypothetical protein